MHSFTLSRLLFWFTIVFLAALALKPWVEGVPEGRQGLPREITPRGKLAAGEQTTIAVFEATNPSA